MRIFVLTAAMLALAIALVAQETQERNPQEEAVRAHLIKLQTSWNAGDASGFGDLFSTNVDFVAPIGMLINGRQAVAEAHKGLFEGPYKGTHLEVNIEKIRFIRPDVAIAHGYGTMTAGGEVRERSRASGVLVRTGDQWLIESFQLTPIQEMQ